MRSIRERISSPFSVRASVDGLRRARKVEGVEGVVEAAEEVEAKSAAAAAPRRSEERIAESEYKAQMGYEDIFHRLY
jgi:hypothetical protein